MEYPRPLQLALDLFALANKEHGEAGCIPRDEWAEDICPVCKVLQDAEHELKAICDD